ncbi:MULTISPECIES: acetyl-CoA carboxylase biotin carboxylase subunit [Coprobacillaceae]|uniref:acetyl-CoA carboxylase biotin carboxylase subunit n=1 Tax=Coprobacillaceae TaxID=2810280 RepID=UPI000E4FE1EF|nr:MULTISPECIES: acetyl-CoA carboxylase biotin carboxylase subunit [Coprobacillaceae]RHM59120.1 acetyl-CoA carboxylase biotin carboxylase subunit [Coprobacillus sp. AF33-1AC]RHS91793.1 acetyl-CoA carboxylase biotin carboxylase subunit [Erysipelatoclostridium sp. AM42-17]
MFKKILIANRGEIAVRIIRCCKEMSIETVAVYSTADATSLHVQLADEAVCIGPAKTSDSYLNMENILSAAMTLGCDAIHPGFGLLSENSTFARLVEECGMTFIGPSGDVIDQMGNKSVAREMMIKAGVPVVPGSPGSIKDEKEGKQIAKQIGYPVLIKASAGGGGRGMRPCYQEEDFDLAYQTAKAEAKACFGDDDMYLEKLILNPKHIEFQILADNYGHVIHLGERDCSIQRRNQKMIEEAPSRALSQELREKMGQDAIKAAKGVHYRNAGTIEFVLDQEGNYYFIEMNTRIQVEHPITEMITGVDLIREQIRIAANLKLNYQQSDIHLQGHAIECRINAENPKENFRPSPGKINSLHIPGGFGVRVDTTLYQGYQVSSHYDSMIAKVIVHGANRLEAIRKMRRVLGELVIDGIDTNQELQYLILHHSEYVKGHFDTGFIEKHLDELVNEQ